MRFRRRKFTIDMPDEGWGLRIVEFVCPWCGPRRAESVYNHPDGLGMTEQEFWLQIHYNDYHLYDPTTRQWSE